MYALYTSREYLLQQRSREESLTTPEPWPGRPLHSFMCFVGAISKKIAVVQFRKVCMRIKEAAWNFNKPLKEESAIYG